ncbi:MAG: hypothetical protein R3B70_12695 [Polyangiaceae bacterium]
MNKLPLFLAAAALLLALPGCGNSTEGSCERIVEACHEKDTGSGEPHDCHESAEAEDATDAVCADIEDACLAACK